MQMQSKFIVKKLLVDTYGYIEVVSVFGASTLNVAEPFSTFSTLNTFEHSPSVVHVIISLLIGIDTGVAPFGQQV